MTNHKEDGNGLTCDRMFKSPTELTFDDVIILPPYSGIEAGEITLEVGLSDQIRMWLPLISSPMDTVTEWKTAVQMALHGGLGVIHFNLTPEEQSAQVRRVKRYQVGFIDEPVCCQATDPINLVRQTKEEQGFSTLLVTEDGTQGSKLIGMVMKGNVSLVSDKQSPIKDAMIPLDQLTVRQASEVKDLTTAREVLRTNPSASKLPLLNHDGSVNALVTREDIEKSAQFPNSLTDANEQLRVGAAVSTHEEDRVRIQLLLEKGVDLLVIDSAQGGTAYAFETIRFIKEQGANVTIMAGNVVTPQQAEPLIEAGAQILRVGMGSGSICITQEQLGIGRAQLSAVYHVAKFAKKRGVSVVADGGIRTTADIIKALACGAHAVMVGRFIVGCDETPARVVTGPQGIRYKVYRGMGSREAILEGGQKRYGQASHKKAVVVQGVSGGVETQGPLGDQLCKAGLAINKALEYCGCRDVSELHESVAAGQIRFALQSIAAKTEGRPHDLFQIAVYS